MTESASPAGISQCPVMSPAGFLGPTPRQCAGWIGHPGHHAMEVDGHRHTWASSTLCTARSPTGYRCCLPANHPEPDHCDARAAHDVVRWPVVRRAPPAPPAPLGPRSDYAFDSAIDRAAAVARAETEVVGAAKVFVGALDLDGEESPQLLDLVRAVRDLGALRRAPVLPPWTCGCGDRNASGSHPGTRLRCPDCGATRPEGHGR